MTYLLNDAGKAAIQKFIKKNTALRYSGIVWHQEVEDLAEGFDRGQQPVLQLEGRYTADGPGSPPVPLKLQPDWFVRQD